MSDYITVLDKCVVDDSKAVSKERTEDILGGSFEDYIERFNECNLDDFNFDINDIDTSVFIIDDGGELFRTKNGDYINVC